VTGPTGPTGWSGAPGLVGPDSVYGATGTTGPTGQATGSTGPTGAVGATGRQGTFGPSGKFAGPSGEFGRPGPKASTGDTGPAGLGGPASSETGPTGASPYVVGTVTISGTANATGAPGVNVVATTFTADTGVSTSQAIWGLEREATSTASKTYRFMIPQQYFAPGASSTWEVGLTVVPLDPAAPPPLDFHEVGYTLRYTYK
jgi:hypothetical protein